MSFAQIVMAATKSIKIYYDIFVNLRKGALMRCEIMDLLSAREIEIIYAIKYLDVMFYGFRLYTLFFFFTSNFTSKYMSNKAGFSSLFRIILFITLRQLIMYVCLSYRKRLNVCSHFN